MTVNTTEHPRSVRGFAGIACELYGNHKLLDSQKLGTLEYVKNPSERGLDEAEKYAEELVLAGGILVSATNSPIHQRMAVVPLRWGAPRILVFGCPLTTALGPELSDEPFRAARLWRYRWDARTDLAVSLNRSERYAYGPPTAAMLRVIGSIAGRIAEYDPEWGYN